MMRLGWATLFGIVLMASSARAACDEMGIEAGLSVVATQTTGRADVDIVRQRGAGQRIRIDYGEDAFSAALDSAGRARISFALLARQNRFTVYLKEAAPIRCSLDVADFDKFYRVVLTWVDPVALNLHVVEPGRSMGGFGHVNQNRPNTQLGEADGKMDVAIAHLDEGSSGQLSYVIAQPGDTVRSRLFSFRLEYVTRGATPKPPYCEQHPLADISAQLTILDRGRVDRRSYGTGRAECNQPLVEARRLIPMRQ